MSYDWLSWVWMLIIEGKWERWIMLMNMMISNEYSYRYFKVWWLNELPENVEINISMGKELNITVT